ncbi:MAG: response regulator [bacterium]
MKILLVDDNPENLELLESVLRHYGYEVRTASDGFQAFDKALQDKFDIIISDILMPRMDGFRLCRQVKTSEKLRDIPFVFYTATYTSPEDEKFALGQGADEFILKPKDPDTFIEILRKVIKNHEAGILRKPTLAPEEENGYFKHYSERLIKKLDDKLRELESAHKALAAEKENLAVILRSKERLAQTLHFMADAVITINHEGRITLMNAMAETLTGWSQAEASGKSLTEVFHLVDENLLKRLDRTDQVIDLEKNTVLIARDGTRRLLAGNIASISNREGEISGAVIVFYDITEKQQREEELQKMSNLESIGLLAGGLAHEFNNILTVLLGNLSLAQMLTDSADERFQLLKEAKQASVRAKSLTRQLLTFSKGGTPVKRTVPLSGMLQDTARFALQGSQTGCTFSLPENLWPVEIDEGQIGQAINNIILNADQAMPDGGTIEVRARNITAATERIIHGTIVPAGKYVEIAIQDQGVGIPKEHLSRVFDPYFTTKQTGSGLGLTAAYYIVRKHGGYLGVESRPGESTTFYIYLPASIEKAPAPAAGEEKAKGKLQPGRGRILVMDDEEMIRKSLSSMLKRLGYKVELARDGAETLAIYKKALESGHPFDLVIVDLIIPSGLGGKETMKRLVEIDPGVKAIVSSGYSNDPIMADFQQYGFIGCIAKPYDLETLSRVIYELTQRNGKAE